MFNWEQIQKDIERRFADIHAVSSNFLGEQDWTFAGDPELSFTEEMMQGVDFYSEHGELDGRIFLGISAALYTLLLYLPGRLIYDGVLNIDEYFSYIIQRILANKALEKPPEELRKNNAYVLGVPISLPIIAPLSIAESLARAVGISERAKHQIVLSGNVAGKLLSRWTQQTFDDQADFQSHLTAMAATPTNWWEGIDCLGMASGGFVLSTLTIGGGALVAGGFGVSESLGRAAGISERAKHQIVLSGNIAGKLLSRWTQQTFDEQADFQTHLTAMAAAPTNWWEGMDCLGMATGGFVLSTITIGGGVLVAGGIGGVESLGRAAGISERAQHQIVLSGNIAGKLLSRWTQQTFDEQADFQTHLTAMAAAPTNWWEGMDCLGLASGGFVLSTITIGGGALAAGVIGASESLGRAAGISERARHQMIYSGNIAGKLLSRWTQQVFDDQADFQMHLTAMAAAPTSWWEGMDCLGMATGGFVLSTLTIGGGALAAGVIGTSESLGRAVGISERARHQLVLSGNVAGKLLSRWTQQTFDEQADFQSHLNAMAVTPTNWWEGMDCLGMASGGFVLSTITIGGSALAASCIGASESLGRAAGISERARHQMIYSGNIAGKLLSRWTQQTFDEQADFQMHLTAMAAAPTNWWEGMDCLGLASGGFVLSTLTIGGGALAAGVIGTSESLGRAVGISERAKHQIVLSGNVAGKLLSRWTQQTFDEQADFQTHLTAMSAAPTNWWEGMDCLGLASGGFVLSTITIGGGALAAGVIGASESLGRAVGISERARHQMIYSGNIVGKLLSRWTQQTFDEQADFQTHLTAMAAAPTNWWEGMDCLGMATGGFVLSTITIGGGALVAGGIGGVESLGRAAGISERAKHQIVLSGNVAGKLLSRWTQQTFDEQADFQAHLTAMAAAPTNWWEGMDCLGMASGGFMLSTLTIGGGALAAGVIGTSESLGRAVGISERARHQLVLSGNVAGKLLSRWTQQAFDEQADFQTHLTAMAAAPTNWWEGMDCLGMASGGFVLSTLTIGGGALVAGGIGGVESLGRAAGISERAKHQIVLSGNVAGKLLSRWTQQAFDEQADFQTHLTVMAAAPTNWWEGMDCLGMATGGFVLSTITIGGGALVAGSIGVVESLGRAAGISERAKHQIVLSGNIAGKLLSRWTQQTFDEQADFQSHLTAMAAAPTNWWEGMDCLGLASGGFVLSTLTIGGGALVAGVIGTSESLGRAVGISKRARHQLVLSGNIAGKLLSRWTQQTFDEQADFQTHLTAMAAAPTSWWEGMDCLGLASGGFVLSTLTIGGGALAAGVIGTSESLGRAVGISERAKHQIVLSGNVAGKLLSRWTQQTFDEQADFHAHLAVMAATPTNWWEGMDCLGMATGGFVLSTITIGGGALAAGVIGVSESLGRAAGISERAKHQIVLSGNVAGKLLSRWTQQTFDEQADFHAHLAVMAATPTNWWEGMDCLGMATGGFVLSTITIGGGALAAGVIGVSESLGRAAGISERARHQITLSGNVAGKLLSRWTRQTFDEQADFHAHLAVMAATPTNWWEGMDCLGMATGGFVLSTITIGGSALAAGVIGVSESLGRAAGISERARHQITLSGNVAGKLLSRWTRQTFDDQADFQAHLAAMAATPTNWWEGMDCLGMASGGFVLSTLIIGGGALVAGGIGGLESLIRVLGFSERSHNYLEFLGSYCITPWNTETLSNEDKIRLKSIIFSPINSWWDLCNVVGLIPVTVVAGIGAVIGLTFGILGLSKANYHRLCHFYHRVTNLIAMRLGRNPSREEEEYHAAAMQACENSPLRKFFSNWNILRMAANIVPTLLYGLVRSLIAVLRFITHIILIVPIYHDIKNLLPQTYDMQNPIDRVEKRFAEINSALDIHGRLPFGNKEDFNRWRVEVTERAEDAEQRSFCNSAFFKIGNEARKWASLGESPEENILDEFKTKFKEFIKEREYEEKKGIQVVNVHSFFKQSCPIGNNNRYSFNKMVENIKDKYTFDEEKQLVNDLAILIQKDIKMALNEVQDFTPTF